MNIDSQDLKELIITVLKNNRTDLFDEGGNCTPGIDENDFEEIAQEVIDNLPEGEPFEIVIENMKEFNNETPDIPTMREKFKNKTHTCEYCKKEFTGWTADYIQNTYLASNCPHCKQWNYYKYWPVPTTQNLK